jgi:acetyl-CoA C-acetyltransferase
MNKAYVYDSVRSPRGRGKPDGSLHEVTALQLSSTMLKALQERNNFDPMLIDDVVWGCVTPVGEQGGNLPRIASLLAGYGHTVPGVQVNRFCASGLESVAMAAAQISAGYGDAYVAGGVEMMGRIPMGSDGMLVAVDPLISIPYCIVPQGIAADLIATMYGFTRKACDAFAVESHQLGAAAWKEGRFANTVLPILDQNEMMILDKDEHLLPEITVEALAELKPVFQDIGEKMPGFDHVALMKYQHLEFISHVHHAGNSSGVVDGAAAILLGSDVLKKDHGLMPRAVIRAVARVGTDPTVMLTGSIAATKKALKKAGMTINDIDIFEVNEAFSSVVLQFMQAFDITDRMKINPNGGSIAFGHPLGATGAILLGTALDELERSEKSVALVTLCVAVGMGIAVIIERI